jgi:hypothetical protein
VFRIAALFEGDTPSQNPTPPQAKGWDDRHSNADYFSMDSIFEHCDHIGDHFNKHFLYILD